MQVKKNNETTKMDKRHQMRKRQEVAKVYQREGTNLRLERGKNPFLHLLVVHGSPKLLQRAQTLLDVSPSPLSGFHFFPFQYS